MDARTPHRSNRPSDLVPTYHERPALKPSLYGWTVALYIYVGGLAAGAQIISTVVALLGIPSTDDVVFVGRAVALAGAILGGILLIVDLHTKSRFYNMLRIFRPTSPMSIGTYVLMAFGFWSLLAFAAQLFLGWMIIALVCSVLASVFAWWMTTYTAALLAQTATPLWASTPRLLAIRFASAAMAAGAAAMLLAAVWLPEPAPLAREFANIAALGVVVEFAAAIASYAACRTQGVSGPLDHPPWGAAHWIAAVLIGQLAPIGLIIAADIVRVSAPQIAAAVCILGGDLIMRGTILLAGNESATRPRDYFRLAGGNAMEAG